MRRERANRIAIWDGLSPHVSCFYRNPIGAGGTGQVVIVFAEHANTRDEVTNSCSSRRVVVPPTIVLEPLVAYAFEFEGHTSILVRVIGVHAQSDLNRGFHHKIPITLATRPSQGAVELTRTWTPEAFFPWSRGSFSYETCPVLECAGDKRGKCHNEGQEEFS